jgi:hypothetical protein
VKDHNVTADLDTLAFAAREALSALDLLCERRQSCEEEVYLARCNLAVLAESLEALSRAVERRKRFGREK